MFRLLLSSWLLGLCSASEIAILPNAKLLMDGSELPADARFCFCIFCCGFGTVCKLGVKVHWEFSFFLGGGKVPVAGRYE